MRISSSSLQNILTRSLDSQHSLLGEKQIKISSGQNYQLRSDAPADASRSAIEKQAQTMDTQWSSNVEYGSNWSIVTDKPLDTLVKNLQRTHELAVESMDGTKTAADRQSMAYEIDSILEQVLLIANTPYGSNYLFGGTSGQAPFTETRDANGRILTVGTGGVDSTQQRTIRASENFTANYGATATGPEGAFQNTTENVDVFATLLDLRDSLLAGNPPISSATTGLEGIERSMDVAVNSLVKNGANQNYLQALSSHYDNLELEHTRQISTYDEINMAKEITELSKLEVSLTAAMQMASRLNQMDLTKYI